MSDAHSETGKPGLLFYGVSTWIASVWVGLGLFFLFGLIKLVLPETRQLPAAQPSPSTTFTTAAPPVHTYNTVPNVDTNGTLQTLNARYVALSTKRNALRPSDQSAIAAFNVEAAEYMRAVESFRSIRAEQLQMLTRASYPVLIPTSSSIPSSVPGSLNFNSTTTKEHYVAPYVRANGTAVPGHYQTNRDETLLNNYSTKGNVNPHTGRAGTVRP